MFKLLLCVTFFLSFSTHVFAWSGTVTADLNSPGPVIPLNFVGFSDEVPDVIADTVFVPSNTSLISLIQLLGPNGTFRIGGGSSDTNPPPALMQQIANDVAAFMSVLGPGWNMIYGLDSAINDSGVAVTQAGYLQNALPSSQIAFQIGNEPEFVFGSEDSWAATLNSYYWALTAAYPGVNFGGPDTSHFLDYTWADATVIGRGGLEYLTTHKYDILPCAPNPFVTPEQVMATATVPSAPGVTISEFGIICGGGQQGITDRLLAATYYLRLAQSAFAGGLVGIMPHNNLIPLDANSHIAYYNQFVQQPDGGYSPAPMFYGMYLFAQLLGQMSVPATISSSLNNLASANATIGPNGNANILVVNINTQRHITVKPQQNWLWATANVYLLSGQGCDDPSPVLNGYPIGEGGWWAGSAAVISRGQSVSIPACGAALIEIQP
jgi:hypothetical protein